MKSFITLLFLFASTTAFAQSISGEMWLEPTDDGRLAVKISTAPGSVGPQSLAFKLVLSRDAVTSIEKSGDVANCTPIFTWSNNVSYVVVLDRHQCPLVGGNPYEIARVRVGVGGLASPFAFVRPVTIEMNPRRTSVAHSIESGVKLKSPARIQIGGSRS